MQDMTGKQGTYWQDDEVKVLLGILLCSKDLSLLMQSMHLPTTRAYKRLSRKMAAKGYPWTFQETQSKFKNIKNAFFPA